MLVLGLAGWLALRHDWSGTTGAKPPAPAQAVTLATIAAGDIAITNDGLGTVTPLATVTVRTQIAGQLQALGFHEGQMVHAGDFLAQIDPRPYQAALAAARGTLAHDQALLAQARTDYTRYATLNRQDSISHQQVEDQKFLVQQYEGSIATDQAQIDTQQLNLTYCRITSPVTGRVGLRQVDIGNYAQTSDTNGIAIVTEITPISVIFTLPEDDLPPILARLHAGATLPVTAFDRANTTQLAVGHLDTVDNQIDTTTGTVKLRALFDNADQALFPNQFVNARLLVDTRRGVVVAPNAAVQTGAPGSFVYLVDAANVAHLRVVKAGAADAEHTEITAGLAIGDRVVIDGADRLRDGAHVAVGGQHHHAAPG